jgi:hypothetical protein
LPRPNWSRPLPRPLVIPKVMMLKTLTDVRDLIRHLPKDHRERSTWRYVAALLADAAAGTDTLDVAVALHGAGVGRRRMPAAVKPRRFLRRRWGN